MSQITISFMKDWLDKQRNDGVRVIREIEKWVQNEEGVSLKSTSNTALTVVLEAAAREKFLEKLAKMLQDDFGESNPWDHAKFSGDLAGLDVPTKWEEPPAPEKPREQSAPSAAEAPKSIKDTDTDEAPVEDPRKVVESICSQVPLKYSPELTTYVRETAAVIPTLQKMGAESSLWHQHLLLAVDAGYGRSEFLSSLARLYKAFGLVKGELDSKSVREFNLLPPGSDFPPIKPDDGYHVTWDNLLSVAQAMKESNTRNGISKVIIYIDVSAWQSSLRSLDVKSRLRRLNSLCGTFLIVFRVPFLEGHVLRETSNALNDILNVRTIAVPPTPVDSMVDYVRSELKTNGFELADNAVDAFEQVVLREKMDNSFFGYKTMNKVIQKLIYEKALSNSRTAKEDRVIGIEDLGVSSSVETDDDPAAQLEKLIGMGEVKKRVKEMIAQIKAHMQLTAAGKALTRPAIHMLFTGNPGTGKTTVARILARMMLQAGILRKGHLVEVKGRDLCGQYIGDTAPKTSAVCRDAYGSVLFIDEAYSLFRDEYSSARDYGREVLDTLVAEMENHRDDFCVIMAGYKKDMDAMLKGNAGLRSRIPFELEFPNYTRDELVQIFFSMLDGTFKYEDGLKEAVCEFFNNIPEETFLSKEFSNARLVRNLYERTWGKAVYRQSLEGGDLLILKSDLAGAMSDSEFKKLINKNAEHRTIGFGV